MEAEIFTIDFSCKRQSLESFHHCFIRLLVIFIHHLVTETTILSLVISFVVATKQKDLLRITRLQGKEITDNLWAKQASVNVIAKK